jgi:DNA-binding MurR/RpiR family transcriptional regulator
MHEFSSAERKVARVVLTNSPTVGLETVARLAELAGVSGPTVIRFVNRLGFDSFIDFQRAVRSELDARMASPVSRYAQQGAAGEIDQVIGQHRDIFVRDLQETFDLLSPREFQAAVGLLADVRRRLWIAGGRFSRVLAEYLHLHLQQLRPNTHLLGHDPAGRVAAVLDAGRRDVLVVFDYRRYETETVDLARAVAASGATVVLFTDRWLSPIADVAEIVLPSVLESPSPFETLVPGLAVVEAVVAGLVSAMGDSARRRVGRYAAITDRMVIGWDPPADKAERSEQAGKAEQAGKERRS